MSEKMSTKALRKQLFAAIAMVMVAAIALSTSTYAWFANNNTVQATGMSVRAVAEGGIEIKTISSTQSLGSGYTSNWATVADAKIASTSLYPTSTLATASGGVITSDWYHASADVATGYAATGTTYAKLQSVGTESDTNKCTFTNGVDTGNGVLKYTAGSGALSAGTYYIATTYHIASVGTAASNLKVQGVTVTGVTENTNAKAFDKSLRVAIVTGSNVAIYAPVGYTDSVGYKVATATEGTPMVLAKGTMPNDNNVTALPTSTTSSVIAEQVGTETEPTAVNVYIWYEGEDVNHFTNGTPTNMDGLSVSVDFVASSAQ